MNHPAAPTQTPPPGDRMLRFQGDVLTFSLTLASPLRGEAWLRTNLGRALEVRREIVAEIEEGTPRLARDWFDLPMRQVDEGAFETRLALVEVGHFEAKAYFLPQGSPDPVWPDGPNTAINIEPADTCCANTIYNAFVRQFGPNKRPGGFPDPSANEQVQGLDREGYTVIPPSGTFRSLSSELDFIVGDLGCTVIQLLPIHPTPTIYARMGRFGSPYAALSFTAVDPALAEFDPTATPLEQFVELLDAVHARNAKVLIDIAINHTGWAADLHETHPEWLVRDDRGRIHSPGAWGVTWADLTRLDYSRKDLWTHMADVFLTWCRRGVDGFRCDAGYMIPVKAWTYIIAVVREQYPETIFLLEGLGGPLAVTRELLNIAGFNWAYSELFQSYDRGQIEGYLPQALDISRREGVMVHYAETHDNNRLAARSSAWARLRTALCALGSVNGGFGFANGVEWLATEKINVHEAASLNWGAVPNQVVAISRLNRLLKEHPAFHDRVEMSFLQSAEGHFLVLLRRHRPSGRRLLVVVNLSDEQPVTARWRAADAPPEKPVLHDLLSGEEIRPRVHGDSRSLALAPAAVLCLSEDPADMQPAPLPGARAAAIPGRVLEQRFRAEALAVWRAFKGQGDLAGVDVHRLAADLRRDPVEFCRGLNPLDASPRVVAWHHPRDLRREVMVPPGHCLLVRAQAPFRAMLTAGRRCLGAGKSLPGGDGSQFALFPPLPEPDDHRAVTLCLRLFTPPKAAHLEAPLLYLAPAEKSRVRRFFPRAEVRARDLLFLAANGRGAMLRAKADWAALGSRYDALLAANLHPGIPVNRRILLTRCRAWLVFQGFSQEISSDCLEGFGFDPLPSGWWRYRVPAGQGQNVGLSVRAALAPGEDRVTLTFFRHPAGAYRDALADDRVVRLVIRPDIEDRDFHDLKAPTDDSFTVITAPQAGQREGLLPGASLVNDDALPFGALKDYGEQFISHFLMKQVDSPLLANLAIIDSPGMVDSVTEKGRGYDFHGVVGELAKLADLIVLMFDPHKAGTIKETYSTIRNTLPQTTGEDRIVYVMSRIDECDNPGDLVRSYGTLCWNLSQMTGRKDIPRIFLTFSPDVTRQTKRLEVWVDERNQLKEKILGTPGLRISHILHNVDKQVNELKLVVEAMAAFSHAGRRLLSRTLKIAAALALAAFLGADLCTAALFGFPPQPLLGALFSGQVNAALLAVPATAAAAVLVLAGIWLRKWGMGRLKRRYAEKTDELVNLDTEYRAHKWGRARATVQRLLAMPGGGHLGFAHQRNLERIERFIAENLRGLYTSEPENP